MTGNKNPLQSTLLSPTSSKLMAQYIVKTNLNHHYNKLQNAKARIDNSLPESMLKSQKVRDRKKQESRPNSSKSSQRAKSHQSSRPQSQISYYGNSEEYWMGKYGDDLEAEVERIVQMTLNGRSQDLQQEHLFTQSTQEYIKQTNANYEDTARSTSRSRQVTPQLGYSARSFVSTSEKLGTGRRSGMSTRREDLDLLNIRSHLFTEPEKPFVPKILKSNRSSLLNQYKYYNPPKKTRPKPTFDDVNSPKSYSDFRETGKGETPIPRPRQKANLGDTTTLSPKTEYQNEEYKKVPPLEIPDDEDQRESLSEPMTSPKKSTTMLKERIKLLQSQSTTDLPRSSVSLNKSQSLTTQRRKYTNLNSESSSQSLLESKWEEADRTAFMKEVTEDILMKGLYTSRSIQRVFESHLRKRKGQFNEDEMRQMLNKLQKDIGISHSEMREASSTTLVSSSASAESLDPVSPRINQIKENGFNHKRDRDLMSTQILKEYEEKLTRDEISPVTSEVQRSKEFDALDASKEDQEAKVQESVVVNKSDNSRNPVKVDGDDGLVEEKGKNNSELPGTSVPRPVPRPRPRRRSSTINLVSSSILPNLKEKPVSNGEKATEINDPKSQPVQSNGIGSQDSEISQVSNVGKTKVPAKLPDDNSPRSDDALGFDSKPNLLKTKKDSQKSVNPPKADQKDNPSSPVKTTVEDNYDDDFEDDDDDIIGDSDSDF